MPPAADMWSQIEAHEWELHSQFLRILRSIKGVTIYGIGGGDRQCRLPSISFSTQGWSSRALVEAVEAESNYDLRWGSFYSQRLVEDVLRLDSERGGQGQHGSLQHT
jgi:selenocysteine lyase/cysteine desulfurase